MSNTAQELDARGLNCPLPILRARKALNGLQAGQVLRVRATDPGAVNFSPAGACAISPYELWPKHSTVPSFALIAQL